MSLGPPQGRAKIVNEGGFITRIWLQFFQDIRNLLGFQPFPLVSYTVSTVPDATDFEGHIIYVSDGTSNKRLAVSDGTNWRFPDGNIIS